jgi:hypothetical protein
MSVFESILESFRFFIALFDDHVLTPLNLEPILVIDCKHRLKLLQTLLVLPLINYADTLVFTLEIYLPLL